MRKMIIFILPIVALGQARSALDVCELLSRIQDLNGHMVTVKGPILPWELALAGEDCTSHIVVKGWKFPDAIAILPTTADRRLLLHPLDFSAPEEFDKLNRLKKDAAARGRHIVCNCTGMVETRTPMDRMIKGRQWGTLGFGIQGWLPAQMVIKSVDRCHEETGKIRLGSEGWVGPEQ